MSKAITYFMMAVMLLVMPQFLGVLTVANVNENVTPLTQATNQMMESMASLINIMSYISGIVFGLKGAIAFKEYADGGSYSNTKSNEKEIIKVEKEVLDIKKEEIKIVEFKFNLDFENKLLNSKLFDIEKVINSIIALPVLENDLESKNLVSSTQEKYIQQIHTAYIAIPKELRDKQIKNSTATALAMEQMILIENGLIEIENELLNQQIKDLNIMNRFLKEKFPEEKKYLTANM